MVKISTSIRVRDFLPHENDVRCVKCMPSSISILDKQGSVVEQLGFDHVFGNQEMTNEVYAKTCQPIVSNFMQGFNGTIFAYGQTGSGKTHTILGNSSQPGILPLAVNDIFRYIEQSEKQVFLLRFSVLEIYNEEIHDLIDSDKSKKVRLREDMGQIRVENLVEQVSCDKSLIMEKVEKAVKRRHVGNNNVNEYSSRSHTLFRFIIESHPEGENDALTFAVLHIIDLAGSERSSQTKTKGVRFQEGCAINLSLFHLSNVISKLSEGQQKHHINYRDSKLTRLLQNALSGNSYTAIVCTVCPGREVIELTTSTLKFASKAKRIDITPEVNENISDKALLRQYEKQIAALQKIVAEKDADPLGIFGQNLATISQQLFLSSNARNEVAEKLGKFNRRHSIAIDYNADRIINLPSFGARVPKVRKSTWNPPKAEKDEQPKTPIVRRRAYRPRSVADDQSGKRDVCTSPFQLKDVQDLDDDEIAEFCAIQGIDIEYMASDEEVEEEEDADEDVSNDRTSRPNSIVLMAEKSSSTSTMHSALSDMSPISLPKFRHSLSEKSLAVEYRYTVSPSSSSEEVSKAFVDQSMQCDIAEDVVGSRKDCVDGSCQWEEMEKENSAPVLTLAQKRMRNRRSIPHPDAVSHIVDTIHNPAGTDTDQYLGGPNLAAECKLLQERCDDMSSRCTKLESYRDACQSIHKWLDDLERQTKDGQDLVDRTTFENTTSGDVDYDLLETRLRDYFDETKRSQRSLESQLGNMKSTMTILETQYAETLEEKEQKVQQFRELAASRLKAMQVAQQNLSELESGKDATLTRLSDLENEAKLHHQEMNTLRERLTERDEALESQEAIQSDLRKQIDAIAVSTAKERATFVADLEKYEAEMNDLKLMLATFQTESSSERPSLPSESRRLSTPADVTVSSPTAPASSRAPKIVIDELERALQELETQRQSQLALEKEVSTLRDETSSLQHRLTAANDSHNSSLLQWRAKLDQMEKETFEASERLVNVETLLDEKKSELREKAREITRRKVEKNEILDELEASLKENETAKVNIRILTRRNEQLRSLLEPTMKQLNEVKTELRELEERFQSSGTRLSAWIKSTLEQLTRDLEDAGVLLMRPLKEKRREAMERGEPVAALPPDMYRINNKVHEHVVEYFGFNAMPDINVPSTLGFLRTFLKACDLMVYEREFVDDIMDVNSRYEQTLARVRRHLLEVLRPLLADNETRYELVATQLRRIIYHLIDSPYQMGKYRLKMFDPDNQLNGQRYDKPLASAPVNTFDDSVEMEDA